jgi:cellulose synthase/poly-beta-1,6-N-acetylglucosamine synthase-like glycosyltransferase
VVATRDDPAVVAARVANLLDTDYPAVLLTVIVAVDATSTWPLAQYQEALPAAVRVVAGDAPGGKAATLNVGVRSAPEADILLFADSAQTFARHTIPTLVARLDADPQLGAVSGLIVQPDSGDGVMDGFWRFEVELRKAQERLHSIICVSGAVYALRRALWRPMPTGLICDDLFVTMSVAGAGYRVALAPDARALDARRFTRAEHFARKVRTQVGLLQVLAWCPWVLNPARNPMWAHLLAHKVLRVVTPALIGIAGVAAAVATAQLVGLRWAIGAAAAGSVGIGLAYAVRPSVVRTVADRLAWLVRLQSAPIIALGRAIRGDWDVWRPARSAVRSLPDAVPDPRPREA